MVNKCFLSLLLSLLILASFCPVLVDVSVKASQYPIIVPDDYPTIQEAINNADFGDVIHVRAGTYYEHVVIDKTVTLLGENMGTTMIDGNRAGVVVDISGNNVTVTGFSVANGGSGSWPACNILVQGNFTTIRENNITNNADYGVLVDYSHGNNIVGNTIADNRVGVYLWHSIYGDRVYGNNLVSRNVIANDTVSGISLLMSENNVITGNTILRNNVGVAVSDSHHNEISLNTIRDNSLAIRLEGGGGSGNTIYFNNFVNNRKQAEIASEYCQWDQGYPLGGNYWSDYNGTDLYSGPGQSATGSDGIGDAPRVIDASNQDNYPLMGKFYNCDITFLPGLTVTLISNSTISLFSAVTWITDINTSSSIRTVWINFTDETGFGFCRVSIPHAYMNVSGPPVVIDYGQTPVLHSNYTLYDNGTDRWIYFAYNHSARPSDQTGRQPRIIIIPEFPSILILPLLMTATLPAIIHCKKKRRSGIIHLS